MKTGGSFRIPRLPYDSHPALAELLGLERTKDGRVIAPGK